MTFDNEAIKAQGHYGLWRFSRCCTNQWISSGECEWQRLLNKRTCIYICGRTREHGQVYGNVVELSFQLYYNNTIELSWANKWSRHAHAHQNFTLFEHMHLSTSHGVQCKPLKEYLNHPHQHCSYVVYWIIPFHFFNMYKGYSRRVHVRART